MRTLKKGNERFGNMFNTFPYLICDERILKKGKTEDFRCGTILFTLSRSKLVIQLDWPIDISLCFGIVFLHMPDVSLELLG